MALAGKKIEEQPVMVVKSSVVTGMAYNLDGSQDSDVRNSTVEKETGATLEPKQPDVSSSDYDLASESELDDE